MLPEGTRGPRVWVKLADLANLGDHDQDLGAGQQTRFIEYGGKRIA